MGHLSESDLAGFESSALAPPALRRVVRYLLSGCAACGSRLFAAEWHGAPDHEDAIERALATVRSQEEHWQKERVRRDRGLVLVRSKGWQQLTPSERRGLRGGWAEVEILLEASAEARYRDTWEMLRLARRAKKVADRLDSSIWGQRPLSDLHARVVAELGNALRVNEDFAGTEVALQQARGILDEGSGDLLIAARIDDIEGSLRKDQRRLEDAEILLARVHRKYLKLGELHLAGRALLNRGLNLTYSGQPIEAIRHLRKALTLLDPERDPQLVAAARHDLLLALAEAGRFREASEFLLESGLRLAFANDPLNLLRLRWVEGKIMAGRGKLAEAERVAREVRAVFQERGLEFVATMVGVDLAKILLQQGKLGALHHLTLELRATAEARGLQEPARHALISLEVACRAQVATVLMVENVRRFLHRLQHDPYLRWHEELLLATW